MHLAHFSSLPYFSNIAAHATKCQSNARRSADCHLPPDLFCSVLPFLSPPVGGVSRPSLSSVPASPHLKLLRNQTFFCVWNDWFAVSYFTSSSLSCQNVLCSAVSRKISKEFLCFLFCETMCNRHWFGCMMYHRPHQDQLHYVPTTKCLLFLLAR